MLEIQTGQNGAVRVVRLVGQLTAIDADHVEKTLGELCVGEDARLAVDLSELKTIDSSGLSALIHLVTRARITHARVVLVGPTPFVSGILSVTRLDRWFDVCPTMAEAGRELG